MRTRTGIVILLVFSLFATTTWAEDVKLTPVGVLPVAALTKVTQVNVFYETDHVSFVCLHVLLPDVGTCGDTSIKECYPTTGRTTFSYVDKSFKHFEENDLNSEGDNLYSFFVKDDTNNKKCHISVVGKTIVGASRFGINKTPHSQSGDNTKTCEHITLRCF